jgi:hypothetical protein
LTSSTGRHADRGMSEHLLIVAMTDDMQDPPGRNGGMPFGTGGAAVL